MGLSEETLAVAKKYTNESISGISGTLAGKNCTIKSITAITGGNRITFEWTADDSTTRTQTMDVMNGTDGADGKGIASISVNSSNHLIITYSDGTTADAGEIEINAAVDSVNGKKGNVTITASDVNAYTKTEVDTALGNKADKATTLSGYGITDAYSKTETDTLLSSKADSATTLSGYGITDAYTKTETDTLLDGKADSATTLSGYGITDAYTKTEVDTALADKADSATTLSGYGITDAYTSTETDSAITAAIEALDVTDSAVAGSYVTEVSETDGAISVTREAADTTPTSSSTKMVTSGGVKTYVDDAIEALDVTDTAVSGSYVTAVSETDGEISVTREAADATPTASSTKMVTSGGVKTALDDKVDWESNGVLGAKNLLPTTAQTTTQQGITFTKNDDDSWGIVGTSTADSNFICINNESQKITLKANQSYTLSGSKNARIVFEIILNSLHSWYTDKNGNHITASNTATTFTNGANDVEVMITIRVYTGVAIDAVVYPMLRLASDTDDTYKPYAKTNHQLTEDSVTWDDYSKLGAVNLLPNNATTQTVNGITFTVNSNKVITATVPSTITETTALDINTSFTLSAGTYKLHGCPSGIDDGTTTVCRLQLYKTDQTTVVALDNGSGAVFSLASDTALVCKIRLGSGLEAGTYTFYPMLTLASYTGSYVPYAKTNKELTSEISNLNSRLPVVVDSGRVLENSSYTFTCTDYYGYRLTIYSIGVDNQSMMVIFGKHPSVANIRFATYNCNDQSEFTPTISVSGSVLTITTANANCYYTIERIFSE